MKLIFIYITILLAFTTTLQAAQTIVLAVGQSHTVPATSDQKIWIEKSKVLKVKDLGTSLVLTGTRVGSSTVKVGNTSFQFLVSDISAGFSSIRFQRLLQLMSSLSFSSESGELIVKGRLKSASDWLSLASLNFTQWKLRATLNVEDLRIVENALNRELTALSYPTVQIDSSPFPLVRVASGENKSTTEGLQILKRYGLQIIEDEKVIAIDPLIRVKMTVAEVRKSTLTSYGIRWPNQFSAKVLSDGSFANRQLTPDLLVAALENSGEGRVLASPTILCRSGKEAEFLAGGEIPIKLVSEKNAEVIWKKYGIRMNIKPKSDPRGRLRIELETEVSSIDPGQKIDGVPAIFTNRVMSHFDLPKSQTIFLSGLIKKIDGKSIQGLPGLSQLPILGPLFSSREFQRDETELVILVTPEIVRD